MNNNTIKYYKIPTQFIYKYYQKEKRDKCFTLLKGSSNNNWPEYVQKDYTNTNNMNTKKMKLKSTNEQFSQKAHSNLKNRSKSKSKTIREKIIKSKAYSNHNIVKFDFI